MTGGGNQCHRGGRCPWRHPTDGLPGGRPADACLGYPLPPPRRRQKRRGGSSQASLQVPAGSSDAGIAAPIAAMASVAMDRPPPSPGAVTSLADVQFDTGRPEVPESTIGGQTTCIACFVNPKSHAAVPCGHRSACGDCSAKMTACPVCRGSVLMWMHVRDA